MSVENELRAPADAPFELSIAVPDPWVTDASTATLDATVRNVGNRPRRMGPAYHKGSSGYRGEPGILLYSLVSPDSPPDTYRPPCFSESTTESSVSTTTSDGEERVTWTLEHLAGEELDPGDASTNTIVVVDDPTTEGCLPAGRYPFGAQHPYGDGREFEWEWDLVVEEVS